MRQPTRVLTPYLVAAWLLVIGVSMLVAGDGAYTGEAFVVVFDLAPRPVWGAGFTLAALAWLIFGRTWAFVPMAVLLPTYALALLSATLQGKSGSPTGWVWPAMSATVLLVTAAHRGIESRYP